MKHCMTSICKKFMDGLTFKKILLILLGAMICTFGIHNIHQRTNITEGGVIGLMLLVEHWLKISPAYITPILDITCYLLAFKFLGGSFIKISIISTMFVSGFYKIWELFPPMLPDLSAHPLVASVLGGIFVGVGVGLIVRQGGSSGGDDALALTISHISHWKLSRSYLFTDVVVLLLSLTYIPVMRIVFSLIPIYTVGGLAINDDLKEVTVDGEPVKLTPIEYNILLLLVKHQGKVFSIDQIYENIWNENAVGVDNTVAVHIRHIREKIEINPKEPRYLKVVWGVGYKIEKQ